MNAFHRWLKFNLVGLMGTVVQLAALALLNRVLRGHYLIASTLALELTLLHNFVWHLHFTWHDRRGSGSALVQCWRFHLANGLVSLVGNLGLMRVLVQEAHWKVLPANATAIVLCGLGNFVLGHRWAFAEVRGGAEPQQEQTARA